VVRLRLNLLRWLERHPSAILLGGIAASLAVNGLAYQKDRKAARRLKETFKRPVLPDFSPLVSFLVPAWNEGKNVEACILSILALRYPNKELVLCAGGRDGTLALCSRYVGQRVIVLKQVPGEGKQGALRRCFEHSNGEIIFCTDADCVVDDECLEAVLAPLLLENEDAVTGYWQPFEGLKQQPFIAYQWANHLRYQAAMPNWAGTLDGRCSAIRREALAAAGGFRNEAATGTDYVLSQKLKTAGYRIRSVLASRVQTEYPAEIPAYLQQGSRWYRNRLVQGVRCRQWKDVALSLWGAGAALFMLVGPLSLVLRWRAASFAWLAGLSHMVLSQVRLTGFFSQSGFGQDRHFGVVMEFIGYAMVSNLSMIKGLRDSLDWRVRRVW
jgi:cellulose synthase/poly-beta-1,6-N-acetylglucosamine synthase-like glycosyltransferase